MTKTVKKNTDDKRSLTRRAYDEIKWRIIADKLHAGSLLSEKSLCEMIGLGKAPIRAALSELKHDKLVDVVPRKGFFVRPWSMEESQELLHMRRIIEPKLAAKAATAVTCEMIETLRELVMDSANQVITSNRRVLIENDNNFHVGIARASGISVGAEIVQTLKLRSHYLWHVSISNQKKLEQVQMQHENILKNIVERNPEGAQHAMLMHLSDLGTY